MSKTSEVRSIRRDLGKQSVLTFARMYFPLYADKDPCEFHRWICDVLMGMSEKRDENLACAAPRGHAKSTIVTFFYVMWSICYAKEKYIVIFSETAGQSKDLLSRVRDALESNEKLKEDFPEVFLGKEKSNGLKLTQTEIITANGIRIKSGSLGQGKRGMVHKQNRPTLIIFDDADGERNTYSSDTRNKLYDWFTKMAMNLGTPGLTNLIVIGTVLHEESLLARLLHKERFQDWQKKSFKAVVRFADDLSLWLKWNEILNYREQYKEISGFAGADAFFNDNKELMLKGAEVLWPQVEDYYELMKKKYIIGERSFASEKQNEPISEEDCRFDPEKFFYWDKDAADANALLDSFKDDYVIVTACDPSVGAETKKADSSAIVSIAVHKNKLYVLEVDIKKRSQEDLTNKIIDVCKTRKPYRFILEENLFRGLLGKFILERATERGVRVPLEAIYSHGNKELRIIGMETYVTSGIIVFSRSQHELLRQLKYFPRCDHDDAPDALEMAVSAVELIPEIGFCALTGEDPGVGRKNTRRSLPEKPIVDKWGRSIDDRMFGHPHISYDRYEDDDY